ncbi:hypothetical protein [Marivivens marinus]|uniref:hypothetical protein n=1 Tax=Marivivens marinus TaxID=3110173 RepID=UPI003B847D50
MPSDSLVMSKSPRVLGNSVALGAADEAQSQLPALDLWSDGEADHVGIRFSLWMLTVRDKQKD